MLARIDESLALCGTDKSKILSAIIYLNDVTQKKEFNRAWDEWADPKNPPMRACIGVDIEPPHLVEIVVTAAKYSTLLTRRRPCPAQPPSELSC